MNITSTVSLFPPTERRGTVIAIHDANRFPITVRWDTWSKSDSLNGYNGSLHFRYKEHELTELPE